jgi:hypothetical protein
MKRIDPYDLLGVVAMIATPMAAALVFGWELYLYFLSISVPTSLAIVGAVSGAIAMESVGVYAGHVGIDYARRRDWRGLVAAAAMVFYIWFGWSKAPAYGAVFVLAGFVYALVALRHEAVAVDEETAVVSKQNRNWQHRMELEQLRMKHEEKLARISTPKTTPPPVTSPVTYRVDSGQLPADFRLLTGEQKDMVQAMTTSQLTELADISDSTARRWKRQVAANGYHK